MSARHDEHRAERLLRQFAQRGAGPADVDVKLADDLVGRGLLREEEGMFRLTSAGRSYLRRRLSDRDGFANQHRTLTNQILEDESAGRRPVVVNADESPLARLRRMKGRDGKRLIGDAEFVAGERLRMDFTRAQLMPRVTASWSSVAQGRRGGKGISDVADAAIEARRRVDRAADAVGPEFSGVLIDFCCFLKGIEEIEKERSWPARSAKLVIGLALASLARHYGLSAGARGTRSGTISHWGTADYRPVVDREA